MHVYKRSPAGVRHRFALLAGMLLFTATQAAAQLPMSADEAPRAGADPAELESEARALAARGSRYGRAAALYLEAANLRGAYDARAVENRLQAARLFYYDGQKGRAQQIMESTAQAALAIGDIVASAHAFMDAASIAEKRARPQDVHRYVERARLLMESPLIDAENRERVLRRIAVPPVDPIRFSRVTLPTGVTLQVAEAGPADGEPVLFLHGYTDSWFSFEPVMKRLPKGIRAIVPSQRGHGDSERPACCYRAHDFADDAIALLDALKLDRVSVVGHSMGSFVAQRVAIDHPERVDRLVLTGSGVTAGVDPVRELNAAVAQLTDSVPADFVRDFQASTAFEPLPAAFFEGVIGESRKLPARLWREVLASIIASDAKDELHLIEAPTLIIWGEEEQLWPRSQQEALARAIPGARIIGYPRTGHAPNWERPDRFVSDLTAFLSAK